MIGFDLYKNASSIRGWRFCVEHERVRDCVTEVVLEVDSGEELLLQAVPWGKKADKDP